MLLHGIIATLNFRKAIMLSIILLAPKNLIIIPAIIISSVSGIKLYKSITKERKSQTIKFGIIKHTVLSMISFLLVIVASFVEAYITPSLLNVFKTFL